MSALLEVRAISKSFRGLRAVHAASFEIPSIKSPSLQMTQTWKSNSL